MNKLHYRFFNIAKELSLTADYHGAHVGAVVVEGRRIISTGVNTLKTNPLQQKYNRYRNFEDMHKYCPPFVHAEVNALNPLIGKKDINWNNISIYIYRQLKDGSRGCSKPCQACEKLIKDLGIHTIYYIDEFGNYCKERRL